jgi:hypothetical protein
MKVVVTATAFYKGSRVRPGTELEVPDTLKGTWFAKVDAPEAKAAKAPKPKTEPRALSEMPKGDGKTFIDAHSADIA